jgi:hypothetical protein
MSTKPRSATRGRSTFLVEVTNISSKGLWLLIDENEHFLPYKQFPWFREARVSEILAVTRPSSHHLYWPDLDVDLAIESIVHPERYPLVSVGRSNSRMQRTSARSQERAKGRITRGSPRR